MSEPFVGEIKIVGFPFAPRNFMTCAGQLLPIRQYTALFAILGTNFGGDGVNTFALPDFQASTPIGAGQGPSLTMRSVGESAGQAAVTLIQSEIPMHVHTLTGATLNPANPDQNVGTPANNTMFGASAPGFAYSDATAPIGNMSPLAVAPTGGNQPHENRQPFLALNFVIAVQGIFPSRN
ncbi:phage tail protein [Sphingomonas qomolangmaensis]|uniref:Tail fiber protein n=1 Tax=Sphingomonas qomolangmaensis TaxID=2918765 RepID=A0ABY5LCN0_9SPHN|nr:tail fiber protein [Sphingomonas qomolangmaensis]UUL82456.1 tail fiber protein [Sphingomonas qomolangmaensis]